MSSIPNTIQSLRTTPVKGGEPELEVVSIPFGTRKEVQSLNADELIVRPNPRRPPSAYLS